MSTCAAVLQICVLPVFLRKRTLTAFCLFLFWVASEARLSRISRLKEVSEAAHKTKMWLDGLTGYEVRLSVGDCRPKGSSY